MALSAACYCDDSSHAASRLPAAQACSASVYTTLRDIPDDPTVQFPVTCRISLDRDDLVTQDLAFFGAGASGASIDCHGGTIGIPGKAPRDAPPTILIASVHQDNGAWSVPHDISIKNCRIYGSVHIMGLGANAEADEVRQSSLNRNHTQFAQSVAPTSIVLDKVTIIAAGPEALYIAPGVTHVTLSHSVIGGTVKTHAVYMDAESAHNSIVDTRFETRNGHREMMAIDGSANNLIQGNSFINADHGGIYVFRNCGEGGTIRHQEPRYNRFLNNRFDYDKGTSPYPAIWLGAHEPFMSLYCYDDPPAPFGSGANNGNFADNNIVTNTVIDDGTASLIRDNGAHNQISGTVVKP